MSCNLKSFGHNRCLFPNFMIYITNALSINLNWIGIKDVFVETFFVDRIYFHNDAGNDWNPFWMEKGYIYPIKIINICVSE